METIYAFCSGVAASLVASGIIALVVRVVRNRNRLKLYGMSHIKPNEMIRISAAYLFRIVIDGRYLLIKGSRIKTQFQPVGGVYKRFDSAKGRLDELKVCADDSMKSHTTDPDDLRVQLPRKNAIAFLEWFDGRTQREVSTLREFREELIVPGYLDADAANRFNPAFVRSCERKIEYSQHLDIYEIHVHEVYEVTLCEHDQASILSYVDGHPDGELVLVDKKDIDRGTFEMNGDFFGIASTAKKVL